MQKEFSLYWSVTCHKKTLFGIDYTDKEWIKDNFIFVCRWYGGAGRVGVFLTALTRG